MPVSICPTNSQCLFHAVTGKKQKQKRRDYSRHTFAVKQVVKHRKTKQKLASSRNSKSTKKKELQKK